MKSATKVQIYRTETLKKATHSFYLQRMSLLKLYLHMMKHNIHHRVNVRRHFFRRKLPQDTSLNKYRKHIDILKSGVSLNKKEISIQERNKMARNYIGTKMSKDEFVPIKKVLKGTSKMSSIKMAVKR